MRISLPRTKQGHYRLAVSAFYFIQGLVFASWASRIPDIKTTLGLNDAALGGVLFAIPVGQLSAMALSGFAVSRFGSRKVLTLAAFFYPAVLVWLGIASTVWELCAALFFFGITANLCNIAVNTQGVGVSSVVPICYSMAGKSTKMLPGVALAAVSTIGFLGFLIGPPLIGFVAQAINLRWSLGLVAIIGITTSVFASKIKEE